MTVAVHLVERLTLDLVTADLGCAVSVRARAEALAQDLIPATLERLFDQLVPRDLQIHIDRLALDLGSIAADDLERDIPAALEHALREVLPGLMAAGDGNASHGASGTAAVAADLDAWLLQGRPQRPGAASFDPAAAVLNALAVAPAALAALLRRHGRNRRALARLVRQAGEAGLAALLRLLAPEQAAAILLWLGEVGRLVTLTPAPPLAAPVLRETLWLLTFEYLLRDAGSQFNRRSFVAHLLQGVATAQGIALSALLAMLRAALVPTRRRRPFATVLGDILDSLADEPATISRSDDGPIGAADAHALATRGDPASLIAVLRANADDPVALAALITPLRPATYAAIVDRLAPAQAATIIAFGSGLAALHGVRPLVAVSPTGFVRAVRLLALRFLLRDAGSEFNRQRWLESLLRGLAAAGGVAYQTLLASVGEALDQMRRTLPVQGSLPGAVAALVADLPCAANGLHPASTPVTLDAEPVAEVRHEIAALLRLHRRQSLAAVSDTDLAARLHIAAAHAGTTPRWWQTALAALPAPTSLASLLATGPGVALHTLAAGDQAIAVLLAQSGAAGAFATDIAAIPGNSDANLRQLALQIAVVHLSGRRRFDRNALRRALLAGLTLAGAQMPSAWPAQRQAGGPVLPSHGAATFAMIARFLCGEAPVATGSVLPSLAASDPHALVKMIRQEAARSGRPDAVLERLLDWLLPVEIAALLWPTSGTTRQSIVWAATRPHNTAEAWRQLLTAGLRSDAVPVVPGPGLSGPPHIGPAHTVGRRALIAPAALARASRSSKQAAQSQGVSNSGDLEIFGAWLAGDGPATLTPAQHRRLANRLRAGDAALVAVLRRRSRSTRAMARWAMLPDAAFAQVLLYRLPTLAAWLIDVAVIIMLAAAQGAAPAGGDYRHRLRLAMLQLGPQQSAPRVAAARLVAALAPLPPDAFRLRAAAVVLARTRGDHHVVAALRPPLAVPALVTPPRPAHFAQDNSVYVANAGLVLFNPFLPRFLPSSVYWMTMVGSAMTPRWRVPSICCNIWLIHAAIGPNPRSASICCSLAAPLMIPSPAASCQSRRS